MSVDVQALGFFQILYLHQLIAQKSMTEHGHTHDSYGHPTVERRQSTLPSISSRYPHSSDSGDSQPSSATSMNYPQPGGLSAYDPVHDQTYGLPRISTGTTAQPHMPYSPDAYSRGERNMTHGYGAGSRFDLPTRPATTLPPMEDHRRERHHYTPSHELESLSYRAPTHAAAQGLHSFRVQTAQGGEQRNQVYASSIATTSGGYPTLPPLNVPGGAADEKGPVKRIVMACHQCRARKIRCDADRPVCGNCQRRREECRYDEKPKRRGPDKVPGSRMRSCKSKKQALGSSGLPEVAASGSTSSGVYSSSDLPHSSS